MKEIKLKPIGFVKTKAIGKEVKDRRHISQIILDQISSEALMGLEEFSHLFVLFWMHRVSKAERIKMKVHPRGRSDMPLLGIFATRTPYRPNPIGLTLVEVLKVDRNILTIRGLDAFDGTPILDIKPFDSWDMAKNAQVPHWWIQLKSEKG
ncbi:MAG: tRNA (N6-threonylcarbamoyladenosine(37)-N6)-methyltransferase TrmO [Candidatus Bathyarchaeota archaeon]|nr:MAG: tRNA (N6-threonylcarbamoyladenosine(37)-N6)-methyltransferase TrmO [Candidatus Bathyarchaeota archaeon]